MSINSEIERLKSAKSNIKAQANILGANIQASQTIDTYASSLASANSSILNELQKMTFSKVITLTTTWSDNKQTVSCTGISETDTPIISAIFTDKTKQEKSDIKFEWTKIIDAQAIDNAIEFYCETPTQIPIQLLVKGK